MQNFLSITPDLDGDNAQYFDEVKRMAFFISWADMFPTNHQLIPSTILQFFRVVNAIIHLTEFTDKLPKDIHTLWQSADVQRNIELIAKELNKFPSNLHPSLNASLK